MMDDNYLWPLRSPVGNVMSNTPHSLYERSIKGFEGALVLVLM